MSDASNPTPSPQAEVPSKPVWQRAIAVAVAALAVVGLVAILGFGPGSTTACSSCHVPQAAALVRSPHAGIACRACHFSARGSVSSRIDVLARMLPATIGGTRLRGPGRPVGNAPCIACHPKMVAGGVVDKNGLRINHTKCIVASPCEDCHSQSIHGTSTRLVRGPKMAECVACHVKQKAPLGCAACHAAKLPASLARDPEWARTHGPDWKTLHGTGDLTSCTACHDSAFCRPCHHIDFPHPVTFGTKHGTLALTAGTDACFTCHKGPAYCDGCHGIEMPHPTGFLQRHSSVATSDRDPKCATCHVLDDCDQCHTYHVHPGGTGPAVGRNGSG